MNERHKENQFYNSLISSCFKRTISIFLLLCACDNSRRLNDDTSIMNIISASLAIVIREYDLRSLELTSSLPSRLSCSFFLLRQLFTSALQYRRTAALKVTGYISLREVTLFNLRRGLANSSSLLFYHILFPRRDLINARKGKVVESKYRF